MCIVQVVQLVDDVVTGVWRGLLYVRAFAKKTKSAFRDIVL